MPARRASSRRSWLASSGRAAVRARAHNNLERSSALFRPGRVRARRRLRPEYLRVNEAVYRAIGAVAGDTAIVDSSHYPLRARELQ